MKKTTAAAAAALLLLTCASCSSGRMPSLQIKAQQDCTIIYGDKRYQCTLSFPGNDIKVITINSPESLSGMTFRSSGGRSTVSYGGLICRTDKSILPENSFPSRIYVIMDDLKKEGPITELSESGDGFCYCGKNDREFKVKADKDGNITEIII